MAGRSPGYFFVTAFSRQWNLEPRAALFPRLHRIEGATMLGTILVIVLILILIGDEPGR
jgi:hypothetical protein